MGERERERRGESGSGKEGGEGGRCFKDLIMAKI